MIIPDNAERKRTYIKFILDTCLMSRADRRDLYDKRRLYFLFGTANNLNQADVRYNRIESHLDLVSAFLFSPDHATFSLAAPLNSPDDEVKQFMAAEDKYNQDFRDAGLFDTFGDAMPWALVFDSMLLKCGWNETRSEPNCQMIQPDEFGVFAEEITDLDEQQAFVHSYHIDYDNAVQRLTRAGLSAFIDKLTVVNTPFESPFPEMITRMIVASTGGGDLTGNVTGSINPSYIARPSYTAKVDRPLVALHELTVWDDDRNDYRLFFVLDPDIIISDSKDTIEVLKKTGPQKKGLENFYNTQCNPFFPKEHPYIHIRPYPVGKYFWGKAHIESLIPLQDWSTERLDQIHDLLEKQAYPPRVGSGFLGLSDEKMEAFGGADSWVMDQLPGAKIEQLYPKMPEDIFADYTQIGQLFMEASGLTEVLQGRSTSGVRSQGHAKELKSTGAGRIRKTAIALEGALTRMGDIFLKLHQRNSDSKIVPDPQEDGKPGNPFYYHNLSSEYSLRVAGHSHSPLFVDDTRELAAALFKAQAIDREQLLRLLNPPNRDAMIHALRSRMAKEAQQRAMNPQPQRGGKPKAVA